jgi:hypothetical protein
MYRLRLQVETKLQKNDPDETNLRREGIKKVTYLNRPSYLRERIAS